MSSDVLESMEKIKESCKQLEPPGRSVVSLLFIAFTELVMQNRGEESNCSYKTMQTSDEAFCLMSQCQSLAPENKKEKKKRTRSVNHDITSVFHCGHQSYKSN